MQFQIFTNYALAKWVSVKSSNCWEGDAAAQTLLAHGVKWGARCTEFKVQQKLCDKGQPSAFGVKTAPGRKKMAPKPMYFSLSPFPFAHFEAKIENNH